jgi:hypothetical protein
MNTIRPFEVGTTVKWCDDGRESAGVVIAVHTGAGRVAEVAVEPTYLIRRPDLSEISKTNKEVVLV